MQRKFTWPRGLAFLICALSAALGIGALETRIEAKQPSAAEEASWSPNDCATCHDEAVEALGRTAHVALDRDGLASDLGVAHSCAACHGDPSSHYDSLDTTDLFTFDQSPAANAQRCLSCHAQAHPRYARSEHARAGLDCTACHQSHPPAHGTEPSGTALSDLGERPSATCASCHESSFVQFAFTEHHRIEEGTMECTSCHDPHAPATRTTLGGFKQEACVTCHADKGGPFVFEHGAQRVEGCVSCHDPHGSPNRHMLKFQRVAEQCYSCHAFVPGFHTRFTAETQCTSCHAMIHGSNLDAGFLK